MLKECNIYCFICHLLFFIFFEWLFHLSYFCIHFYAIFDYLGCCGDLGRIRRVQSGSLLAWESHPGLFLLCIKCLIWVLVCIVSRVSLGIIAAIMLQTYNLIVLWEHLLCSTGKSKWLWSISLTWRNKIWAQGLWRKCGCL